MSKTANDWLIVGGTDVSTCKVEGAGYVVVKRNTAKVSNSPEHYVRAQYIKSVAGKPAKVIATLNSKQVEKKAVIRDINNELQGRNSVQITTGISFAAEQI